MYKTSKTLAAILLVSSFSSMAQTVQPPTTNPSNTCREDEQRLCPEAESNNDRLKCLANKKEELSDNCKQEIMRVMRAAEQTREQSEGQLITPSAFSSFNPPMTIISASGRHIPGPMSQHENKIDFSTPVVKSSEKYFGISLMGARTHFKQDIALKPNHIVPKNLKRAEVGLQYTQQLAKRKSFGVRASFGYAGDKVFDGTKDALYNIILSYGYPTESGNFMMWNILFSNNGPFGSGVPVPGFMYIIRRPTFTGMFGLPMISLQWTPTKAQAYSFSMLGLNITTEMAFGDINAYQFYGTAKWQNQRFILEKRLNNRDRLTLEEKRAGLGVRTFAFGQMLIELESGYSFERIVYSGDGLRNMRSGSAKLPSDWYGTLSAKVGF